VIQAVSPNETPPSLQQFSINWPDGEKKVSRSNGTNFENPLVISSSGKEKKNKRKKEKQD
jgi:hypothetical protein